jgi:hypothetical protein
MLLADDNQSSTNLALDVLMFDAHWKILECYNID